MTIKTEVSKEQEATLQPNNLAEALSMRYPAVWVQAVDTVEVIQSVQAHIALYEDLDFYLFNAVNGLQYYNYHTSRFDTVLHVINSPMGPAQVPITDLGDAVNFLQDSATATLFVANVEQFNDDLNDIYTFFGFSWRDAWSNDTVHGLPLQLILSSSTEPSPPAAVAAFVPTVSFSLPDKDDFVNILTYVAEKTEAEVDINAAAVASRGLTSFEAINLYHSMAARNDCIDHEHLQQLTFERLAARSGLDIIRPEVSLDQVAGGETVKKILETSIWVKENPEEATKLGYEKAMHRFLMLGLPGTGKSMLCEGAANFLKLNLIRTGVSQMMSKWHGESENNMRAMFRQIDALDPVCVWCDEFGRDVSGGQSSHVVDGGSTARVHGIFLTGMQELADTTYFFAAANDITTLAPEMLRADRFDRIFFVGFPTFQQRIKIITDKLAGIKHEVNIESIAAATGGFTGAELITGIASAALISIDDRRPTNTDDVKTGMVQLSDRMWTRHRNHVINEYKVALSRYQWASEFQKAEAESYVNGKIPTPSLDTPIAETQSTEDQNQPIKVKANIT